MTTLGFVVAIGPPLAVLVGVVVWPTRIPPDRTVDAIRRRVESETEWNRVRSPTAAVVTG
ncbi:hypothetical protein [Nocardia sp. NPDC058497]|uniref:hypothetical protein n=1 Tax=Nocardia sp. NPDC058497 TaxID=3346529 RepID=UPI00365A39A4